jgi:cytochrome c oxidase subunit II
VQPGQIHMLQPAGPQARHIDSLFTATFWIGLVAFAATITVFGLALRRGRRRVQQDEPPDESAEGEHGLKRAVTGATIATVVVLFVYLALSVRTGRALATLDGARGGRDGEHAVSPLTIEVVGHQWWWEIRYRDSVASRWLTTANELRLPVGRPVQIVGRSADVIHSFWVPNLHGKRDLVPGDESVSWLRADTPGVWYGQCAEFCGHQHAHMRLTVIAEPPERFDAWYAQQLKPAPEPITASERKGRDVFVSGSCMMCHAINGTPAGSRVGPDLTHLASRSRIAAGTLPNTRGHLAGWILDPQSIKPGTRMPPNALSPEDLHALLDYLQSLR